MSEKFPYDIPKEKPTPNPLTKASHKSDVRKQITIPLVFSIIAIGVFVFILINQRIGNTEVWAHISAIFLLLFSMIMTVFPIVLMIALIVGMHKLLQNLPIHTRMVQDAVDKLSAQIKSGVKVSVQPIIKIQQFTTQINDFFSSFSRKRD